jgi:hypothetical protein
MIEQHLLSWLFCCDFYKSQRNLSDACGVRNQDIGFVDVGQAAMVKIETFLYTRNGYLTGKVIKISNDATQDKKQGLVFAARIQLPTNKFKVGNKWVNLTPGMAVTAEIKTGKQKGVALLFGFVGGNRAGEFERTVNNEVIMKIDSNNLGIVFLVYFTVATLVEAFTRESKITHGGKEVYKC